MHLCTPGPVVQWIEYKIPVLTIWVRFPSGLLRQALRKRRLSFFCDARAFRRIEFVFRRYPFSTAVFRRPTALQPSPRRTFRRAYNRTKIITKFLTATKNNIFKPFHSIFGFRRLFHARSTHTLRLCEDFATPGVSAVFYPCCSAIPILYIRTQKSVRRHRNPAHYPSTPRKGYSSCGLFSLKLRTKSRTPRIHPEASTPPRKMNPANISIFEGFAARSGTVAGCTTA